MKKETLIEAQQTAGFFEANERVCLGGYFNNLLFFKNLKGGANSEPSGKLAEAINKQFTDFSSFKEAFKKVVSQRFLPGWVWLGLLKDGNLIISQTNNQDNNLMMGIADVQCTPVLALDLWEHAYWSDHDGEAMGSYLDSFWGVIDWAQVSATFESHNLEHKVAPIN